MNKETVTRLYESFQDHFGSFGMNETLANILVITIVLLVVTIIATLLDIITRKLIIQVVKLFGDSNTKTFDDFLMESNFPRFIAHFVPVAIFFFIIPIVFKDYEAIAGLGITGLKLYGTVLSILAFRSILRTLKNYAETREKYHDKPIQSYVQVMMIFAWGIGIFFFVTLLFDFNFGSIATLGATSAIVLLIFKDTLLGFVASIQVSVNDIVRIGDWITFSKFGADGYVTEINLATVLVQNFDNTITTIPTYSLIADSFQNWRGMQQSKGRRIKRSLFIKQNTIHFMDAEKLDALKKIQLIAPYIKHREKDVLKHNTAIQADKAFLINGRNQTNLGIFRNYAESFLLENKLINQDLLLMVRHLQPTDKGIPIEIFCFSYDKTWENYERIQADIFDHLIAAIPYFGLELFESPSGSDFGGLTGKSK